MSDSTGKTPKPNKSQPAKLGAAQPPQPPAGTANLGYGTESFLRIDVPKGATIEQISDAVTVALGRMTDVPFFQCCPPLAAEVRPLSARMAPCEILWMCMRQEGP
jgi:hypothetical protein